MRLIFIVLSIASAHNLQAARTTQQEKELWNWKTWISIIIGTFMAGFVLAAAIYYRMRKKQA